MIFRPGKMVLLLLVLCLMTGAFASGALALDPQPEPPAPIMINIDGRELVTDVAPIIESGRTLLPLRAIFEALGAQVEWSPADETIKATRNSLTIVLKIGSNTAFKNGVAASIDVPPRIVNNRTLVPLRFVSEALGASVQWDGAKRQVSIGTGVSSSDSTSNSSEPAQGVEKQDTSPGRISKPLQGSENQDTPAAADTVNDLGRSLRIIDIPSLSRLAPQVRLNNGKIYPLMPPGPELELSKRIIVSPHPVPKSVLDRIKIVPPEATVDLRQWQTPIRDQAGRNTCVTYAVLGAMEAAYKRLDPVRYAKIDLSEQYGNHLQKMVFLMDSPRAKAELRENELGRWGYSGTLYMMTLLGRPYCVPGESLLPYISGGSYENTNEAGDNPRIDPADTNLKQKTVDDINLSETDFPRAALDGATYGISSYVVLPQNKLNDVNYYKGVLAAGYEIAFSMKILTPDPSPNDKIWNPGTNHVGNHAMLMVGYDEGRKVFILKNSWGFDNILENGFTLLSYDWVTQGNIYEAGYITGVTDAQKYTRPEQKFLGRWKLNHDGWKGTLDIYHLPGFFQKDWARDVALFGDSDNRIGTYYNQDGTAYRVNGSISGNRIEFYIDFDKPNLNFGELRGKRFIGYLFGWQTELLAGTMASDGQPYGFYATRADYLKSSPASGEGVKPADYAGVWAMNHDGWKGTLTISSVDAKTNAINASYKSQDGKTLPVKGFITENRRLQMDISFNDASPQPFSGLLYSWEKGIMSGSTTLGGGNYGWVATRSGPPPIKLVPVPLIQNLR